METLITLLDDSSYEVKRAAADSLAEMGSAGKPALPKLIALLQNSDTNLQEAIRFAITTIDTNLIIEGNQVRQGSGLNAPK